MKRILIIFISLVMAFSFSVAFSEEKKPLSLEEVGDLLQRNVSKKKVLVTIEENGVTFPKTKANLETLKQKGLDETVLAAIEKEWKKDGRVLIIETIPTGASILLDGEGIGETPLEVEGLKAKKYSVRAELGGYEPVDHEISLTEGIGRKLTISLVKSRGESSSPGAVPTPSPASPVPALTPGPSEGPSQMCSIFVNTQPTGAKIYVNGKHYGTSPKYIELSPGEHSIVMVKEFYKPEEKKIVVREGDTVLPPIDQRLVPTR
jgi:PEGA domain